MPEKNDTPHTLLALCGTSPAILTETIWALAMEYLGDPAQAELPHRIIVLTTSIGRQSIVEQLLTPDRPDQLSLWMQLRQQLEKIGFPIENRLRFGPTTEHIRCFSSTCPDTGLATPLDDLRSSQEQTEAADYILETLRGLTETPDSMVTASLAGGRKTMSALLYGAMTLIGREDHRLTHVLVDPPYDLPFLQPRFYFPKQDQQELLLEEKIYLAADAAIELADIPFVPLRYAFRQQLDVASPSFRQLAATYKQASIVRGQPRIEFDTSDGTLLIASTPVKLSPLESVILLFLLIRAIEGLPTYTDYDSAFQPLCVFISELKEKAPPGNAGHWHHKLPDPKKLSIEDLRKPVSGLRRRIRKSSPIAVSVAEALPVRGRFSLDYPLKKITLL